MPTTINYETTDFTLMQDGKSPPELSGWYVTFEWYIDMTVAKAKHKYPKKLCAADFMWWDSDAKVWRNLPGSKASRIEIKAWFGLKEKPGLWMSTREREAHRRGYEMGRARQRDSDARKCREIQAQYVGLVKPVHIVAKECEEAINTNVGSLT